MGKRPYIALYIGDWEQDTNTLSLEAEGAWLKIIFKMHKGDQSGVYKISTNGLQNLWRKTAQQTADIIEELKLAEICGILENPGFIQFTNRRLNKAFILSKKRSEAVKNRYKNDTKDSQFADSDSEYDNNKINGAEIVFPFSGEDFKFWWETWIKYRNEIKKPYKSDLSIQAVLKKLSKFSEEEACKMIEQSIEGQWQGIFEIKKQNGSKQTINGSELFQGAMRPKADN